MADPVSITFTGSVTVEEVMAALAKQSVFDLPTLARAAVAKIQETAEAEDAPPITDLIVHAHYVYVRKEV